MSTQAAAVPPADPLPPGWDSAGFWLEAIREARAERSAVLANLKITRLHEVLSRALARVLAPAGGPNFHTWAVWGSRKAGVRGQPNHNHTNYAQLR